MSAAEEIGELERLLSRATKDLTAARVELQKNEKKLKSAQDAVEAERSALKVAESNLRHMRGPATHVVLSEFAEVRRIQRERADALQMTQQVLAKETSTRNRILRAIPIYETVIADCARRLAAYGQVLEFPL